jgi:hypothetical protein
MKFKQACFAAALAVAGLGSAQADQSWVWSYTGAGVTASGTFTTAGAAVVAEDILSFTGQRNGAAITGLVALGADPDFLYDNQFSATGDHFTDGGVVFSVTGHENVNLYFFGGEYVDLFIAGGVTPVETPVSFTVSASAVPEPATVLSMLAGLGLLGVYAGQRRRSAA